MSVAGGFAEEEELLVDVAVGVGEGFQVEEGFPARISGAGLTGEEEGAPEAVFGFEEVVLLALEAEEGEEEIEDGAGFEGEGADAVELGEEAAGGTPGGAEAEGGDVDMGAVLEKERRHEAVMAWG